MERSPFSVRTRALGLAAAVLLVVVAFPVAYAVSSHSSTPGPQPWSFGIMADSQWASPDDPDGTNPDGVADSIVHQVNAQFIKHGVKFVMMTGDLQNNGTDAGVAARAAAAKELYDAGIGFFPMRGNHELLAKLANGYSIPAFRAAFPQTQGLGDTYGAHDFTTPVLPGSYPDDLKGLSYSFDYGDPGNDIRIIAIDPWATTHKLYRAPSVNLDYGYRMGDQQPWIDGLIDAKTRPTEHVLVFAHPNLMAENHVDTVFMGRPANPLTIPDQNAFFASLAANGVRYVIGGHDHVHQRSIVTSPDGKNRLHELIAASESSKFYDPKPLNAAGFQGQKVRELSIAQDVFRIGYYIVTVAGDQLTFDYYADEDQFASDQCFPDGANYVDCVTPGSERTPELQFVKRDSWGYDLGQGQEYKFGGGTNPPGGGTPNGDGTANPTDYTLIHESFEGTTATILSGSYPATVADFDNRPVVQAVDTGWTEAWSKGNEKLLASDIFTLWGMAPVAAPHRENDPEGLEATAPFTLQMTYDPGSTTSIGYGGFGIGTRTDAGTWVNAVDLNIGGTKAFIVGPWDSTYGLGSYGVDPQSKTVWAVVNHDGAFAAANGIELPPDQVVQP